TRDYPPLLHRVALSEEHRLCPGDFRVTRIAAPPPRHSPSAQRPIRGDGGGRLTCQTSQSSAAGQSLRPARTCCPRQASAFAALSISTIWTVVRLSSAKCRRPSTWPAA